MQPPKLPVNVKKTTPPGVGTSQSGRTVAVPPPLPERISTRTSLLPWICLGGSGLLFVCVAAGIAWQLMPQRQDSQNVATPETERLNPDEGSSPIALTEQVAEVSPPTFDPDESSSGSDPSPAISSSVPVPDSESDPKPAPIPAPPPSKSPPASAPKASSPAFTDLDLRDLQLELPKHSDLQESAETRLAKIPVSDGEEVQLALLPNEESGWKLVPAGQQDLPGTIWTVRKQAKTSFGETEDVVAGQFRCHAGELKFQWARDIPTWVKPESLQFRWLEVRVGSQVRLCQLWKTVVVNPVRINLKSKTPDVVPLAGKAIDRPEEFRVCFQLGNQAQITQVADLVGIGEKTTIPLSRAEGHAVELELKLVAGAGHSVLEIGLFGNPPQSHAKQKATTHAALNTETVNRWLKSGEGGRTKKEKSIKTILSEQSRLESQKLSRRNLSSNDSGIQRSTSNDATDIADSQIANLQKQLQKLEAELETMEHHEAWCRNTLELLGSLDDQSIHYAVFIEGPQRLVVLKSSGFDWNKLGR